MAVTPCEITEYIETCQLATNLKNGVTEALVRCVPSLVTAHRMLQALVLGADGGGATPGLTRRFRRLLLACASREASTQVALSQWSGVS